MEEPAQRLHGGGERLVDEVAGQRLDPDPGGGVAGEVGEHIHIDGRVFGGACGPAGGGGGHDDTGDEGDVTT